MFRVGGGVFLEQSSGSHTKSKIILEGNLAFFFPKMYIIMNIVLLSVKHS